MQSYKTLSLLLGAALIPSCIDTSSIDPETEAEASMETLAIETSLGIHRIDHDDGTFSYALPASTTTPATKKQGAVTLRYDGQARFDRDALAIPKLVNLAAPGSSTRQQLVGSVTVDSLGRRWVTDAVDDGVLARTVADYNTVVAQQFGHEADVAASDIPSTATPPAPEWVMWTPTSWNLTDCNSDNDNDMSIWDTDNRALAATSMSDRQKKYVILSMPNSSCTGTMVGDHTVLTAAHCVAPNGYAMTPNDLKVCSLGNYLTGATCLTASSITVNSGWSGIGDSFADDFAVIHLPSSMNVGWMPISQASDATIKSKPNRNVGYPGFAPGCANNTKTKINSGARALGQYWSEGEVTGLSSTLIRTHIDTGGGHSGGSYYYYPNDTFGDFFLTAVHSGHYWYYTNAYNGGPKGPAIRSWVIANM